jgi:hypothetical protein
MIKLLIALKKRLPFIWRFVEYINGLIFRVLFYKRLKRNAAKVLQDYTKEKFTYRFLAQNDLQALNELLQGQNQEQFRFFKPHKFDLKTLKRLFKNPSFFMFGVFNNNKLIGYFFLRCFANKKSFIGRLVDANYQGQGLGKIMGKILYQIAWSSGFRIFSTISIDNVASFNSHKANQNLKIVKELSDNYYLVEFVKSNQ